MALTYKNDAGFTLLEILLSVAIITILAGISLPVYGAVVNRNQLETSSQQIVMSLRRAQTYARGVNRNSQWGVRMETGQAVLFKGDSYAARDVNFDERVAIPGNMTLSGLSEVVFAKLSAAPSTTGTLTVTLNNNETRRITLNGQGMVEY